MIDGFHTLPGDFNWKPKLRRKGEAMRPPRRAESYRAARKNAARGDNRGRLLKEQRELTGETRREMDRRREAQRRLRLLAEQNRAVPLAATA